MNSIPYSNPVQQEALPMRLSRRHRLFIYTAGAVLVTSGIAWLIAHYFLTEANEFGESHHPSEPLWLRIHGAGVMAFLVLVGTILPGHVTRAWSLRKVRAASVRRNVTTGTLMLSLVAGLVLTGYGLYYLGSEELRPYISTAHWVIGLTAAVGFYQHLRGRLRRAGNRDAVQRAEPRMAEEPAPGAVMLAPHPKQPV